MLARAGKGTQVWKKSGAIFDGDWKAGLRHGFGTLSVKEGDTHAKKYAGGWKNDKRHVRAAVQSPLQPPELRIHLPLFSLPSPAMYSIVFFFSLSTGLRYQLLQPRGVLRRRVVCKQPQWLGQDALCRRLCVRGRVVRGQEEWKGNLETSYVHINYYNYNYLKYTETPHTLALLQILGAPL